MAHDDDLADLEHLNGKLQRRRNAVMARIGFKGRHERRHIADHEYFAGAGVEDLRGIDSAVGAGDDHDARALPFAQFIPSATLLSPAGVAEAAIAFEHVGKVGHAQVSAQQSGGWQEWACIAI